MISKVHMPQNQNMVVLSGKYTFSRHFFLKFENGSTQTNIKGNGSDSDWRDYGSDSRTDYGNMDCFGYQKMYSINFGKAFESDNQVISIFAGYENFESTNEFKNVIYHLDNGTNVGNATQPDVGANLKATFEGILFGISDDIYLSPKFALNLGITISAIDGIDGSVSGHWPTWNWTSSGTGNEYTANIGAKYLLTNQLAANFGYYYNYIKTCGQLDSSDQAEDFEYQVSGFKFGLSYEF
jgi:opacity protein-like surface antigen